MNKCKKRYIDSDAWVERLKEEREETTNDKRKLYLTTLINAIDCQPTLDEKEIIRKPFERVVERLEEEKDFFKYHELDYGVGSYRAFGKSIQIVKEECGINE